MIRLLLVLFCFLAFSQEEKRIVSEGVNEGLKKVTRMALIPLKDEGYSNEELSKRLIGNDFFDCKWPWNLFLYSN